MITYKQALRATAIGTLKALGYRNTWEDLLSGAIALVVLAVRLLILLTFPISVPLIALLARHWLNELDGKRQTIRQQMQADRDKLIKKAASE